MIIIVTVLYNYYITTKPNEIYIRFSLKPIPVSLLILNIISYFIIYRMHVYAILIEVALLFCLLGDILLMFYVPTIPKYNNILFLIVGGGSFFIARGIMSLAFAVYPYRNNKERCIETSIKKIVFIGIIMFIYTVGMIVYFTLKSKADTVIKILLPIYFISMEIQLFMALLRIRTFK